MPSGAATMHRKVIFSSGTPASLMTSTALQALPPVATMGSHNSTCCLATFGPSFE